MGCKHDSFQIENYDHVVLISINNKRFGAGIRKQSSVVHRYHTVFLPSDVFRLILSQMRKNKKTEDRDGQFVY